MIGVWKAGFMVFVFSFPIHLVPMVMFCFLYRREHCQATSDGSPTFDQKQKEVSMELPSGQKSQSKYSTCQSTTRDQLVVSHADDAVGKCDDDDIVCEHSHEPSSDEAISHAMSKLKTMLENGKITDEEYAYNVAALTASANS